MPGFKLGLGCDCCESGCTARINVIMSDYEDMDDSGVTITTVIKEGVTTIATFGPESPAADRVQYTETLTAGTTYTVTLTVEQAGGETCVFTREFTVPDPCPGPFSINLHIPRVWVAFYYCNSCRSLDSWGMAIDVTGPGGFEAGGTTTEYPDPPPVFLADVPRLKFAFTPCAEGDYTITPTLVVPNTAIDPLVHVVAWPGDDGTAALYWADLTPLALANTINPAAGYVWPRPCNEPVSSTLYLSSTNLGSGELTATADGECGDGWTGTTGGLIPDCDGVDIAVSVAWTFRTLGDSWVLSGVVEYVCLCRVLDSYSQCRWTVVGGGTGEVTIAGSQAIGEVPCVDCSALEFTLNVVLFDTSNLTNCPDQEGLCAFPVDGSNVADTVTITV